MPSEFVHLHLHSQFSLLDGAIRIPELVAAATADGQRAIAVTDHGNLFATVPFFEAAKGAGLKPIIGCEVYVAKGSRHDRLPPSKAGKAYNHLILLAADQRGYRNLVKIVSTGYTEGFYYKPRVDLETLASHSTGLIALSACLNGVITEPMLAGRETQAIEAIGRYQDIFGKDSFYLELQDHAMPDDLRVLKELPELGRRTGAPLVATNDCHYMLQDDSRAHDVLLCIQTGKSMQDPTRWRFHNDQFYFKTQAEMVNLFAERPDAIRATVEIAERVDFKLETGLSHLPTFEVPGGQSPQEFFRKVARGGFDRRREVLDARAVAGTLRYPVSTYRERLEAEIEMIERMGFEGYFLIVWDFIRHARESGVPVGPGRGSAAGSLVAWCLWITDIDPIHYDLLFERFLNPERVSMPDIDIDFCMRGRASVIEYVTRKYGRGSVAQIITFGTMAARAAIRDVGRALELGYGECDRIAKLVPPALDMTLEKALETVPALKEASEKDQRIGETIELARRIEGLQRHASVHAAGVVIAPGPITDYCPLYKTSRDEIVTQFAKDDIEKIGLLKMDFLGLRTLTVIADCVKSIKEIEGITIDVATLGLEDSESYRLFAEGRTSGVFQFESTGMKDILRRLRPDRFEDLIALNALYRPGPMQMIDDYINRRHGRVEWDTILPELAPILSETYGVMVYQEQVMRIASTMAGFSLGEADILRKAMGKKKADVMATMKEKFLTGSKKNKIPAATANRVFTSMERFASYAFNKSHSAAYALLAYQTAYLKAHHPVHFMCAVLTSEEENTKNVVKYISECRDMGLEVLPPDVNRSDLHFRVTGAKSMTFGLAAVKNVGVGAIENLLLVRAARVSFRRLDDLCDELDLRLVNKRVIESLIKAGALDSLGFDRARLVAGLDRAFEHAQSRQRDRIAGQGSLFGNLVSHIATDAGLPDVPPWSELERLGHERDAVGYYLTGHPLNEHAEVLKRLTNADTQTLSEPGAPEDASIGGIVTAVRTSKTKKGAYMAYVSFEDMHGSVELVVFPELYQKSMPLLEAGRILIVRGKPEADEQNLKMIVTEMMLLEHARFRVARRIIVRVELGRAPKSIADDLYGVFLRFRGGVPAVIETVAADGERCWLEPSSTFRLSGSVKVIAELERLLGPGSVRVEGE